MNAKKLGVHQYNFNHFFTLQKYTFYLKENENWNKNRI